MLPPGATPDEKAAALRLTLRLSAEARGETIDDASVEALAQQFEQTRADWEAAHPNETAPWH